MEHPSWSKSFDPYLLQLTTSTRSLVVSSKRGVSLFLRLFELIFKKGLAIVKTRLQF
jgi:hypothetical protein